MLNFLLGLFSSDVAIDLGTATTLVYVKGRGIVLQEPSLVVVHKATNQILAVGNEAKTMLGRTPGSIVSIRPMKDGVIADFEITERMLRHFISQVHNRKSLIRPRIVVAIPSGCTEVEKRAVRDSAEQAGAREVFLVEEPMAAAIGAGLPVGEAQGNMIVDIGGGTTEVAVISLTDIVYGKSIRVAGDEMDEAIISHIKKTYNILIGERTAEDIKIQIGSAFPLEQELRMQIKGRDLVTGLPKSIELRSEEIREALEEPLIPIIETIKMTLERTPPELAADIVDRGIILAGGSSLLKNLDERLRDETGVPVNLADDPSTAVAMGAGKLLDESIDLLKRISVLEKEYN
ncbi:MAG TPA: rod shape-determining protein [bacterium]|nr:rod shape-determining protein [bacterium]